MTIMTRFALALVALTVGGFLHVALADEPGPPFCDSSSAPVPPPGACPNLSNARAECVAGEADNWHWFAASSRAGNLPCAMGTWCTTEQAALDELAAVYIAGENHCGLAPTFEFWCTNYSGGVIAGLPYFYRKNYFVHFTEGTEASCSPFTDSGSATASRTPHCPAGYVASSNNGPCYRVKPFQGCQNIAGNPVQCAGGEKLQTETDIEATSTTLGFKRYYSSNGFYASPGTERPREIMGLRWRHSWQSSVVVETGSEGVDTYAFVLKNDGKYTAFRQSGTDWIGPQDTSETLTELTSGGARTGWIFKADDDSLYNYDASGVWRSLDEHGLVTTLAYSTSFTVNSIAPKAGLLIGVADARGRSLSLLYDLDAYLSHVVDSAGSIYGFRYTTYTAGGRTRNSGLLRYADRPGGSTREYLYDEAYNVAAGIPYLELLTGIVDENGDPLATYQYDIKGRVSTEWHGGLGIDEMNFYYDTSGYNGATSGTILVDALSGVTRRKFAAVAGVVRAAGTDRCSDETCSTVTASSSRSYDGSGNPTLDSDFNGNVTSHTYDTHGRETKRVEALNDAAERTIDTSWHGNFKVPDQRTITNATTAVESKMKWAYNTRAQATARCRIDPSVSGADSYTCGSATNAPAGVRQFLTTYCEASDVTGGSCPLVGLVTSTNGPRLTSDAGMGGVDDITTYAYRMADDSSCATNGTCAYRKGDLWKVTNTLGQVTEYVIYDKNGRVKQIKDSNGTLTDFAYNARGWLTSRTLHETVNVFPPWTGDELLQIDYDALGNVTKVTQPDGAFLAYGYAARRLVLITDSLGDAINYCPGGFRSADCLDAAGNRRVELTTDPYGNIGRQLHRVYNQLGQLTDVLNAADLPVETSAGITATGISDGYDRNGNRVFSDDGLGTRTKQTYDALNRLKNTIQDVTATDPTTQNATTEYTYDTRDNLIKVKDPDLLSTSYTYDRLDNLIALDSPDTGHTSYTYDAAGNRTSQTDNRTPSVTTTYTYDALNRLVAIGYPTPSLNVTYDYDQANTITGCGDSLPEGRLTRMTDSSGSTTYCYNARGDTIKKRQVTNGTALSTFYSYTASGLLETVMYPSRATATYLRDAVGRIQGIDWTPSGGHPTSLLTDATWKPFGPVEGWTFGNGRTVTRAYDEDYAIYKISGTPAGALTLAFDVDVMGNITTASATTSPAIPDRRYVYDPLYRLTNATTGAYGPVETYTYNKTGDRKSASLNGATAAVYAYNDSPGTHHLTSVGGVARTYDGNGNTLSGTSPGLTLSYDDRNRLASMANGTTSATYAFTGRGERVRKTVTVSGTPTTTLFAYDEGGRLIGEYDASGVAQAEYLYLDNIPVGVVKSGVLYYIEADHLGTPRQVVDPDTDTVVWKWDFLQNTFGNSAPDEDPDGDSVRFVLGMRFPGQHFDSETALSYNYFRDYEPGTGRYVESDPMGLRGGINTYSYAKAEPLRYGDPRGLLVAPSPTSPLLAGCALGALANPECDGALLLQACVMSFTAGVAAGNAVFGGDGITNTAPPVQDCGQGSSAANDNVCRDSDKCKELHAILMRMYTNLQAELASIESEDVGGARSPYMMEATKAYAQEIGAYNRLAMSYNAVCDPKVPLFGPKG